jgi:hypothetical protein
MRKTRITLTVFVAVAASALAACQSSPSRNIETADGQEVAEYSGNDYAEEYAVQGGLIGAAGGAALGCLLGEVIASGECGKYALIFGGVGAAGGAAYGYEVGRDTEEMASQQVSAEQALAQADSELEKARRTQQAAANVVSNERVKLDNLQAQAATSEASRQAYEDEIEAAKGFQLYLGGSIERVNDSIADIDQRIAMTSQTDPAQASELSKKRQELEQVRDGLNRQLDILVATIETHEDSLTS